MLAEFVQWATSRKTRDNIHKLAAPLILDVMVLPFIFVGPVAAWIGPRAFLCSVLSHLGFFPGGSNVGAHIDSVIIGIIATGLAMGIAFAVVCAEVYIDAPNDVFTSGKTRGLNIFTLFALFFICGYLWSRSPRMRLGLRVTMFSLTWILTEPISEITSHNYTYYFMPVLITGILSIFSVLIWPLTASRAFGQNMSRAFTIAADMIDQASSDFAEGIEEWRIRKKLAASSPRKMEDPPPIPQTAKFTALRNSMGSIIAVMTRASAAAKHEITLSYVPNSKLEKFRPYFNEFQAWMGCGMGMLPHRATLEYMHELGMPLKTKRHGNGNSNDVTNEPSPEIQPSPANNNSASYEHRPGSPTNQSDDDLEGFQLDAQPNIPQIRFSHDGEPMEGSTPSVDVFNEKEEVPSLDAFCKELSTTFRLLGTVIDICRDSPPKNPKGLAADLIEAIKRGRRARDAEPALQVLAAQKEAVKECFVTVRIEFNKFVARRSRTYREAEVNEPEPLDPATPIGSFAATPRSPFIQAQPLLGAPRLFRTDMYAICLFAVSLFEVAYKAFDMFDVADEVIKVYMSHRYPHLVISHARWTRWLSSDDGVGLFQAQGLSDSSMNPTLDQEQAREDIEDGRKLVNSIFDESHRGANDYTVYARNIVEASKRRKAHVDSKGRARPLFDRIRVYIQRITRLNPVVETRIAMSQVFRGFRRSRHVQFALKLATGVVLLSIPSVLPHQGTDWWADHHGQWMVISYIWCLESSTGDSLRISVLRVFGTIIGCVLGLLAWEISRGQRFALAVLVVLCDIPPILIRLFSPYPPAGAVMGITIPIVALVPFLNRDTHNPGIIAMIRMYMICIGIVAALLVNIIIWPYHARVKLIIQISNTINQLQSMYLSLARQMIYAGYASPPEAKEKFKSVERSIRARIGRCRALLVVMKNEISLVPKPINVLDEILLRLQILSDLFVGLRISREHGLAAVRKKVLWDVIDLRQELVSSIMLLLWVVGQSMLTRARIPQFLPSARRTLSELTSALALQHGELVDVPNSPASNKQASWQRTFDAPPLKMFAQEHEQDDALLKASAVNAIPSTPDVITAAIEYRQRRESVASGKSVVPLDAPPKLKSLATDTTLYLLVEHAIMDQITICLDELLDLTRLLLGEMRFIDPTNPLNNVM
ncbi:hypothetical protein MCUN1_000065 [Malassezia cuniculi]|uniref:Integral membrane bound transporter domain-containing protein n=1 Tax=Malassezia cuniculi TaxID=948313 RepID=A0AAF0J4A2_9BASI|nr:hypothetical protein MCUN1_000065 [Malassezia cuniculi]